MNNCEIEVITFIINDTTVHHRQSLGTIQYRGGHISNIFYVYNCMDI